MASYRIEYRFTSADGATAAFALDFDADTMAPLSPVPEPAAPWARLEFHRCPHCPLAPEAGQDCPAARRLEPLLAWCSGLVSFAPVDLTVITPARTISAATTAQRAISSLMGLILSTSGCPVTAFLRPMARFHLPLASELETAYRAASMYLLAQYFVERGGGLADMGLEGLHQRYRDLHRVNIALCGRIRAAVEHDSSPNAIVLLDCFARALPDMIDDALLELEPLFRPYTQAP